MAQPDMPFVTMHLPKAAEIRKHFDRVAADYDQFAALEQEVGGRLMERLEFQKRVPQRIIDLGSGTGQCAHELKRRYRKAQVIALDTSLAMSQRARKRSSLLRPLQALCADLEQLPLAERSMDLVFSNLAFQWAEEFASLSSGLRRIVRPGGLVLFSTLGPDSMKEFRQAAGYSDESSLPRYFAEMHQIGDALLAAGFTEPVMDSEYITVEYRDFDHLLNELESTGAATHFGDWAAQTASGHGLLENYRDFQRDGRFPVTWEIVYGSAFGPQEGAPIKTPDGDVAAFSVEHLRRSGKR
jgi:malonyl-CoA O-methyltransferase